MELLWPRLFLLFSVSAVAITAMFVLVRSSVSWHADLLKNFGYWTSQLSSFHIISILYVMWTFPCSEHIVELSEWQPRQPGLHGRLAHAAERPAPGAHRPSAGGEAEGTGQVGSHHGAWYRCNFSCKGVIPVSLVRLDCRCSTFGTFGWFLLQHLTAGKSKSPFIKWEMILT